MSSKFCAASRAFLLVPLVGVLASIPALSQPASSRNPSPSSEIAPFTAQGFRQLVKLEDAELAMPTSAARSVSVSPEGRVLVATSSGTFVGSRDSAFAPHDSGTPPRDVTAIASHGSFDYFAVTSRGRSGSAVYFSAGGGGPERRLADVPSTVRQIAVSVGLPAELFLAADSGLYHLRDGSLSRIPLDEAGHVHQVAVATDHPFGPGPRMIAVASDNGLFLFGSRAAPSEWVRLAPREPEATNQAGASLVSRSWNPVAVRAVSFDTRNRLWFGSEQGLGVYDFAASRWRLFDPRDGLPWNGFTALHPGHENDVWLGTDRGLIRLALPAKSADAGLTRDDLTWEVRLGRRYLPNDRVRSLAVEEDGTVWVATEGGLAALEWLDTSLADKATYFEAEIERRHRRTSYGYVDGVHLKVPGNLSTAEKRSSDNDGLWTSMYGAAQCFDWAAGADPSSRQRARQAFEALAFLSQVTQGGDNPAPPGFPARSILPTSGPDPNDGQHERDLEHRKNRDRNWKVIETRWPESADGQWYWKSDTSSDELDGHFFFYALYHDLVATGSEKARVASVVTSIVDHLLEHDYALVDHTGTPTRWAVFGPDALNHDKDWWEERGLNSLSMLSYLRVAQHVSGDSRYADAAQTLIQEHNYAANARQPKVHQGPGTGNQSDNEMAFMALYNLIRYEKDSELRSLWGHTFARYFDLVLPERNPFFNYLYLASVGENGGIGYSDAFEMGPVLRPSVKEQALADALDSLKRYPLDLVDWRLDHSFRLDLAPLHSPPFSGESSTRPRGYLRNQLRVLPIDERHVGHWNHDPWQLIQGGNGQRLADGAAYLLAYHLGRHQGFLRD